MDEVAELKRKFDEAEQLHRFYSKIWFLNLCFVYGKQWVMWDEAAGMYITKPVPSWRFRSMTNRILPTVRTLINKLVATKLDISVTPLKSDQRTIDTAKVAQKVIEYVLSKHYLDYEIAFDLLVFGKAFVKVTFEGDRGPVVGEGVRMGDIVLTHLTPFEVFIDPLALSLEEARWCFIVKVRDVDYVRERYGVEVKPETVQLPVILQRVEQFYRKPIYTLRDAVVVKEYWEVSSSKNPTGRHIVLCGDKIVFNDENPYEDVDGSRYLPIVDFDFFVKSNELYGMSLVEHLIPLQIEYNTLKSDLIQHEKLLARGKWLVPINCGVSKNSITSEPGEKIYYDPRHGTPTPVPGVPPPPGVWEHLSYLRQEFDDIAGVHEISRGRVPTGVRSYLAIAFLQEQDDRLLSITYRNMIKSWIKIGYMILKTAKKFFIENRLLTISGQDRAVEVVEFKYGDLENVSEISLRIIEGSRLPHSSVARQQFILALWQAGLIQDPNKILKMLEFATDEVLFGEDVKLDEINAKTENEEMANGVTAEVQEYDNHFVHLKIHEDFRKRLNFKELPSQIQQIFSIHVQTHRKLIDLAQMRMMELQQELQRPRRGRKTEPMPE